MVGINPRLDALEAAVRRVKFRHLDSWTLGAPKRMPTAIFGSLRSKTFRSRCRAWNLLEGGLTRAGILQPGHLDNLLQRHRRRERDFSTRLWTVMVLNLWHDRWITGKKTAAVPPAL